MKYVRLITAVAWWFALIFCFGFWYLVLSAVTGK